MGITVLAIAFVKLLLLNRGMTEFKDGFCEKQSL